jgi:hopanoid C-3 methylase
MRANTFPATKEVRVKILLVQPAPFEPGRLGLENIIWLSEPVALAQLAAMVPEHEVRILDMRLEPDTELNRVLLDFQPDLVGTTAMTTDCYQAKAVLLLAKSTLGEKVFTIIGGHHCTLCPQEYEDAAVDAVCIGEGEDTFAELIAHLAAGGAPNDLGRIKGLRFRSESGAFLTTPKRPQVRDLDTFPAPARHLIPARYKKEYFFTVANPMASIFTSRGCSFDCNFCAIWEFYERRTRYMSAKAICDRLEKIEEDFVFFLDDNFLTNKKRLEQLCEEIEQRGIKKYFGSQGRTDFIAENPELMARLRDCGLMMVLSGYETNDADALKALRKSNTLEKNKIAAARLRELGIVSTGIFMARPDFDEKDFALLWQTINEMGVAIPLVTILTPLPGTQLYAQRKHELLTHDVRLFDLLHAVTPTRLPRKKFYEQYTRWNAATWPSFWKGVLAAVRRRPAFFLKALPGIVRWIRKANHYRPIVESAESHLRDEIGIIPAETVATPRFAVVQPLPVTPDAIPAPLLAVPEVRP